MKKPHADTHTLRHATSDAEPTLLADADITGETDFLRAMIEQHDGTAQKTGAKIVVHCGNDCMCVLCGVAQAAVRQCTRVSCPPVAIGALAYCLLHG